MAHILVRHTVTDYAKWKPYYNRDEARRKQSGSKGTWLFRSAQNPNDLFIR